MNLIDCVVTKVIGEPYEKYNRWWIKVEYDSWGMFCETELFFNTKEEVEKVNIGYKFLA